MAAITWMAGTRSHLCGVVQHHQGFGVVVDFHLVVVQAEAECYLQTVGQKDVRLMEETEIQLGVWNCSATSSWGISQVVNIDCTRSGI